MKPILPSGPIHQALETLLHHPDAAVQRAAAARLERFAAVQQGMDDGSLVIGSRTPVEGTPAWVTLEVVKGGFATGRLLAEDPEARDLNLGALQATATWSKALATGAYFVELPEHGALPVVIWLLQHGHVTEAMALLDELGPWMDRLRFVPDPAPPRAESSSAHVRSTDELAKTLRARGPQPRVAKMNRTLTVWRPLQDELAALFDRTTVDRVAGADVPAGWWDAVQPVFDRATAAMAAHPEDRRPRDVSTPLGGMLDVLKAAVPTRDATLLVLATRALRQHIASRGAPGSAALAALSRDEHAHAARPLFHVLDHILGARLADLPPGQGLYTPDALLGDVADDEGRPGAPAGTPLHRFAKKRVTPCQEGSLQELVEAGVIGSAEQLATIAPQVTAAVRASGYADPVLRTLVGRIDQAFRRRRGLLLVNLQSQVRLRELPWIRILAPFATELSSEQIAVTTASQLATTAFSGFPQTQLPNPMITELRSLVGVERLTLVEEIAADIFMGTFTEKFLHSATITAKALQGTLYARYFDLPEPRVLTAIRTEGRTVPGYAALCSARVPQTRQVVQLETLRKNLIHATHWRANHPQYLDRQDPRLGTTLQGLPHPDEAPFALDRQLLNAAEILDLRRAYFATASGSVAQNGALLEQNLVLTTHNIVPLIEGLGLTERVESLAPAWADDTFVWLANRLQTVSKLEGHEKLRAVKNAAYAWRQLILWLSLTPNGAEDFLARTDPSSAGPDFAPVWQGLVAVVGGDSFVDERVTDGRRFYGWSPGRPHWLTER